MQDYADQVAALRPMLMKMARARLRNAAWAEDAVSETLVAALEKPHAFQGRSTLQTWLVGILNHQAVNQIRRNTRECQIELSDDGVDLESSANAAIDQTGEAHARQNDPQESLRQRQFLSSIDRCVLALPADQRRAFILRYGEEEEVSDIGTALAVTTNNVYVLLHRARLGLRASLSMH